MKKAVTNRMHPLLKSAVFFLVFVLLLSLSLSGVVVPQNMPSVGVDGMRIAPFATGLSLFQTNQDFYYILSPFNDYEVNPDGSRSTFLTHEEIEKHLYVTDFTKSRLETVVSTIGAYFNLQNPSLHFISANNTISYTSHVQSNTVVITRTLAAHGNTKTKLLGTTLAYNSMDFLYDKRGMLYDFQPDNNRAYFTSFYHIPLQPTLDELRNQVSEKTLFVMNPYLSSVMVIKANKNQTLFVNRDAKLIEVEEKVQPKNDTYTTTLTITIFPDPRSAIQHI